MKENHIGFALACLILVSIFETARAQAQQPLSDFIEAASKRALDVRTAVATRKQAAARREEARGFLLPGVSATGEYDHNQYEIEFAAPMSMEPIVIQKRDQLFGDITVGMPIVDISAWAAYFQSRSSAEAAKWGLSLA